MSADDVNRSAGGRRRRQFAVLGALTLALAALLAAFAVGIADSQSQARERLQVQAHQRALLVSGLIDTTFQLETHVGRDAQAALTRAHVSRRALDDFTGDKRFVVLTGAGGRIVAHSDDTSARDLAAVRRAAPESLISGGRTWGVGDVMPGHVVALVSRIGGPAGTRALVAGVPLSTLATFVTDDLHKVPGVVAQHQLLLDGRGVVVGSTNPQRPPGYLFHTRPQLQALDHRSGIVHSAQGVRWFDQVPLAGTDWKLIVSVPSRAFFASVSGLRHWLAWLILIAFGLMGLVAICLVARSMQAAERIRVANHRLTETNAELHHTHLRLEESHHALERSNAELERQAQELVRSNSELDQFASIASHDLQEPLRKVRTFTERVADTEADTLTERGADYLRRANASAERMQVLIEDLLRFSRVTTHARPFTAVDLQAVAADVLDDLSEQVARSGAHVEIAPLPTVSADAPQMRQLLQNLISNALKFRREDVTPVVAIAGESRGGWLTLTVADNGIGFEEQYAQRIFRVFERLHGRGTYPGTGIGLALCRKIAERHGGTVVAASLPGEGTTFTVTMQTERTEAVSAAPAQTPGSSPAATGPDGPPTHKEPHVAV